MKFVGYHGSPNKYEVFDLKAAAELRFDDLDPFNSLGLWLTSRQESARWFGDKVYRFEVELKKPYVIKRDGWRQPFIDGLYFPKLAKLNSVKAVDRKAIENGREVAWSDPAIKALLTNDAIAFDRRAESLAKIFKDYSWALDGLRENEKYWADVKRSLVLGDYDSVLFENSIIDTKKGDPPHDVVIVLQPEGLHGQLIQGNPPQPKGKVYEFPDLHELSITGVRVTRSDDFAASGNYDVTILSGSGGEDFVGKIYRDAGAMTSMVAWYKADAPGHFVDRFLGFSQEEAVKKLVDKYLNAPSKNPPGEEIEGFHCTSEQNAESILKNGFQFMPYDTESFVQMFSECMDMLGIQGEERDNLEELYARRPNKAADIVQDAWYKRFGGGCVIWISYGQPAREFGAACLSVRLPKTARLLTKDWEYGEAFYVPTKTISAKRFKRIED